MKRWPYLPFLLSQLYGRHYKAVCNRTHVNMTLAFDALSSAYLVERNGYAGEAKKNLCYYSV